jgi:GNAT superfamily N-acetyltransferase
MIEPKQYREWIKVIVDMIPCETDERVQEFILSRPEAGLVVPRPEVISEDHWFSIRRYHDPVADEDLLQIYFGSKQSGEAWIGYDRIDPCWLDAEGRDMDRWELTRAYVRPQFRGQNYCPFLVELVIALCKKNMGYSVVAYPRHVAMLVTLLKMGFKTMDGSYDSTLKRILNQGMRWYANDPAHRRLYYAQEFRPFIIEGSFIMEKRIRSFSLWDFLWEKV